ncbi:hypothetical protein D4764_10G0008610 [Takifugu flavidus]|uniref:Uncharacterized protein n=1 Tax=Takifugu flavidus TaxID=433684 RepID=A0A5C6PLX0_9TELE|nr:hypothetical protein D4764_10G0008610 [Takifugu flavidus]
MEGAKTSLQHCGGTHEQGIEPTNGHIGPCDELATHPGVDLPSHMGYPPRDPERDKVTHPSGMNALSSEPLTSYPAGIFVLPGRKPCFHQGKTEPR